MRQLAFVSDEMYIALAGVLGEFESQDSGEVTLIQSSPRGIFYGDLAPGAYKVILCKQGYGAKTVMMELGGKAPQFRLLSDGLLGYMWPKWVRGGELAEYRVHAVEQYQLTLWRYGLKKEFVRMIGWVDEHGPQANRQLLPDGDFTPSGVRWNNDGYPSPPVIKAPERTGLYYIWARTPAGRAFSFPWVVAPPKPVAPIAVLASTNTWNAYNNFGGRSNYVNANHLPERPIVYSRQDLDRFRKNVPFGVWRPQDEEYQPLSFDRPEPNNHLFDDPKVTDGVQGRVQCGQAPGEWRLYGWLEREGFEYDLYAEAQLHDGTLDLDSYRVLILAVHPEYWTREMYLKVKQWVFERGGRLMYLGGNGLNCEVTLSAGGSMRCLTHLNSKRGELGGLSADGKTVYESRMHRTLESEANLLGVVCSETGIMTSAPYRVIEPDHWIFDGTGLSKGNEFGEITLHERVPGGASGHETDKRSASSPANTILLAKGTNKDDGGSEIVYHKREHGGAVFSVGSITWVSALFTDSHVSRITHNVLGRFLTANEDMT
ncbi:MAG TPA: N,N-dimethylformamidase beta subunit family domain-containing protein [Bryobacteraceae bacterium]|nr:N,N-dimethylformamidase beta subunit family domain-containing protein [Bryobacteraceae bacterium]